MCLVCFVPGLPESHITSSAPPLPRTLGEGTGEQAGPGREATTSE